MVVLAARDFTPDTVEASGGARQQYTTLAAPRIIQIAFDERGGSLTRSAVPIIEDRRRDRAVGTHV